MENVINLEKGLSSYNQAYKELNRNNVELLVKLYSQVEVLIYRVPSEFSHVMYNAQDLQEKIMVDIQFQLRKRGRCS